MLCLDLALHACVKVCQGGGLCVSCVDERLPVKLLKAYGGQTVHSHHCIEALGLRHVGEELVDDVDIFDIKIVHHRVQKDILRVHRRQHLTPS